MSELTLIVNGTQYTLDVPESRTLAQVLRYDLGLNCIKIACGEGDCGICSLLINGQAVDSCIFPAFDAQGATIEMITRLR